MAAMRVNEEAKVVVKVQSGTNPSTGNTIISNRTLNYIDPNADDTKVLTFATAYGGLQKYTVDSIVRTDTAELVNNA